MDKNKLSRRKLLKQSIAAGGAAIAATQATQATQTTQATQGPAIVTGRRFRAWISRGDGPKRTTLQEVTLKPIGGRQVVVRTEASNLCYSNVPPVLGIQPAAAGAAAPASALAAPSGRRRMNDLAVMQGHGGVGIVEAVGPEVRRVQVGDRVCVSGTPQCGNCYR